LDRTGACPTGPIAGESATLDERQATEIAWAAGLAPLEEKDHALAHHRLGHRAEARKWLEQARQTAALGQESSRPPANYDLWWSWATFVTLLREAEAELNVPPSP